MILDPNMQQIICLSRCLMLFQYFLVAALCYYNFFYTRSTCSFSRTNFSPLTKKTEIYQSSPLECRAYQILLTHYNNNEKSESKLFRKTFTLYSAILELSASGVFIVLFRPAGYYKTWDHF